MSFHLQSMNRRPDHIKNGHDEWYTKKETYDYLNQKFGPFTLDPFAHELSHLCPRYYTKEQDAFQQDWGRNKAFCNPPYSLVERAISYTIMNHYEAWFLTNAATDNRWFHRWIAPHCDELYFFRGKLYFDENPAEKRKRLLAKYKANFCEEMMKIENPAPRPSIFFHIPNSDATFGDKKWGVLYRNLKEELATKPAAYHLQ